MQFLWLGVTEKRRRWEESASHIKRRRWEESTSHKKGRRWGGVGGVLSIKRGGDGRGESCKKRRGVR